MTHRLRAGALSAPRNGRVLIACVAVFVLMLAVGGWLTYSGTHQGKQVTAYFSEAISIYPGSDVRILGVKVGTVDSVTPDGSRVRVRLTIDHGIPVPASAGAVIVSPSVVADRYVQLTPAYTGGPQLQSGAVIGVRKTAVPLEVDQLYASLDKLATALGPHGANSHDALSDVLKTGAANLNGNGAQMHAMISQFGQAMGTLGGSAQNLSATVRNLQAFTTMLKNNNGQVIQAEQQLSQVSGFLSADRQNLAAALDELSTALGQVQSFIGSNRALIASNVNRLSTITGLLVKERASLAEAMDDAPLAADNLLAAYDPKTGTLDGRADINEFSMGPAGQGVNVPASGTNASAMAQILIEVPEGQTGKLPPLPLPAIGPVYGTPLTSREGGR
ncbi:MAG TPA: MCE family protein [Streptosporangiaceae bacterium]